jgi:hypothetical protein
VGWDCGLIDCEVGDIDVRFKNPLVLLSDNPKDGWSMVPSQPRGWSIDGDFKDNTVFGAVDEDKIEKFERVVGEQKKNAAERY